MTARQKNVLTDNMKLDPVEECFIADGSSMGGSLSKRFKIRFAGACDIGVVNGGEGDEFDQVNLNLAVIHAVPTASFDLRPPPQAEGHRDIASQHMGTQFPAELHRMTLGRSSRNDAVADVTRLWSVDHTQDL